MKQLKKSLALLLVLATLLAALPISAMAANKGYCGGKYPKKGADYAVSSNNATWTLNSKGVLTIKGKGLIRDGYWDSKKVKSVVIQNGITEIAPYSFTNLKNVTKISFPKSLKKIGDGNFNHCDKLKTLTIPGNVKSIGGFSFSWCKNLTTVTLKKGVTTLVGNAKHGYAFCWNPKLKKIVLPTSLKTIGEGVFKGADSLKTITIPKSVTKIGKDAFEYGNKNLVIKGVKGSAAQKYAAKNHLKFKVGK